MITCCVVGASGYTGVELVRLLEQHPDFALQRTFVSENSADQGKRLAELHPVLTGVSEHSLHPLTDKDLTQLSDNYDAIFLATPHQASHDWMPSLLDGKAVVFDLSGAFRLQDVAVFEQYYGFPHQHQDLLKDAVYGLADWHQEKIKQAKLIAVPGCYPTAALSALKPLQLAGLLDPQHPPIINAVSGVSGAGRKAAINTSFCEVSLQAYGVLGHRHQPEISAHLNEDVIFTPHLGNFKRGILQTITVKLKPGTDKSTLDTAYHNAYQHNPIVRLISHFPRLDDVVNTPYCDLHWACDPISGYAVIGSAIDNLLKGAASQAMQCANLRFGFSAHHTLSGEA